MQQKLDRLETPLDAADLLLGFCLRRPFDRLLDPSCGEGIFLRRAALWRDWLADSLQNASPDSLWGVDMNPETAVIAQTALPHARILNQNFFTVKPERELGGVKFDAVIGNPPYARADSIGRLHRESGEQLAFGLDETRRLETGDYETNLQSPVSNLRLIPRSLWRQLSHRSGLYAYFILHSAEFLREGGRLGFVVPDGWLDAVYGAGLKQFLLEHFRLVALIESAVERWLPMANQNACLVVLEKCGDPERRAANLTRLIRLQRPLSQLIPFALDNPRRLTAIERLVPRLLPSDNRRAPDFDIRVLPQWKLDAEAKWGLTLRAPDVYYRRRAQSDLPPLKSWAKIERGFTTGANRFFYLGQPAIEEWGIEPKFRRPLLKTLRGVDKLQLDESDCQTGLLWLPPGINLEETAVARYIAWGEEQGFHQRRTCAARQPWVSLPEQPPAQIVLPKSLRQRHFAAQLAQDLPADQQIYRLSLADGVSSSVAAALLNSAWFALQCELLGRINFGEGLLWLAMYELASIMLPDPRQLSPDQTTRLEQCFEQLSQRPILPTPEELTQPDRQKLDTAVFDILNFAERERTAVYDTLLDRIAARLDKRVSK
ncbi:MAG: SAM-dependent DNA methyltransferase [Chloroflexi bacterium]|nr:SAM-dependent DNA methyltransferase [Chloroflexota bacterium]